MTKFLSEFVYSRMPVSDTDDDKEEKKSKPTQRSRPLYDIPYMFEAREFMRKKLIGKKVSAEYLARKIQYYFTDLLNELFKAPRLSNRKVRTLPTQSAIVETSEIQIQITHCPLAGVIFCMNLFVLLCSRLM